jgi:hypothetical protein
MPLEKLLAQKIWADEIFYGNEVIADVEVTAPAGVVFTADSTMTGTATVSVLSIVLTSLLGVVTATVEYLVQEEVSVQINATPGPDDFTQEYAFRFTETYEFQKFTLPQGLDIANLQGQVFRFTGTVTLENVDLPVGESVGTFDNVVDTMTKILITEAFQAIVKLGSAPYVQTSSITVVPVTS